MTKLKLFLDDVRPKPEGFDLLIRTAEEAIELIKQNKVKFISLDNDLGIGYTEGYKVANFIEEAYMADEIEFVDFYPHTSNPVARAKIIMARRTVYKKYHND